MKYRYKHTCIILMISFATGCQVLNNSPKSNFIDGYYFSRLDHKNIKRYYLVTGGDSIKVYPGSIAKQKADTVKSLTILFPQSKRPSSFSNYSFTTKTLDLDVITILFKLRPSVKGFPNQFNTNFNGALYTGYRTDTYKLSYEEDPFHIAQRKISHYGYSIGGFAGVGSSRIDEFVTLNRIDYEYDGAVIATGINAELGFNKLNFGLTCGLDFLTGRNKHVWVNEGKPWFGVSLGINLN